MRWRSCLAHCLVGLVVRRLPRERKIPGSNPTLRWDFFGVKSYQWLTNWHTSGYPARPWHYRVSAWTDRPGVSILWLGEVESLVCNFYLSVAAHKIVWADPSLRYTSMLWDVKQPTNKQTCLAPSALLSPLESYQWLTTFFFFFFFF